jgi:hypothetical protein
MASEGRKRVRNVSPNTRGQRGRHQREVLLYATWGVTHRPLPWIRATSRGRFGIEASYRPAHQARIRTSSRHPVLWLLVRWRGVDLAPCVGVVACRSHGGAATWGAAPASSIAAVCPLVVVAADGSRTPLSTLTTSPRVSGRIRESSCVWYHFQLLKLA